MKLHSVFRCRRHSTCLPLLLLLGIAVLLERGGGAFAQQRPPLPAALPGAAVQLPTLSSFSVGTTVTVPDRGSAYLGGIKRAATGRNEFGVPMLPFRPFRNSAIGHEASASGVRVTATIHDFEAMDQFLLSQPTYCPGKRFSQSLSSRPPRRLAATSSSPGNTGNTPRGRTDWQSVLRAGSQQPGRPAYGTSFNRSSVVEAARRSAAKVAEARAGRIRQQQIRASEAADFFERGQQAEASGKANVARILYRMATQRATGQLKRRVDARLAAVSHQETPPKIARARP